jgi:NAD(P)-dependent dehydrogenase (short-subunit alcohol dehydrogenase family)
MAGRLDGKRVIVTDCNEYNGADIVKLFREEGAEVFADSRDLTVPTACDELVREVGKVDILIANLAYPYKYAPVYEKSDEDMEYALNRIVYPLHRLTRSVLPQMLERKKGKMADWQAYPAATPRAYILLDQVGFNPRRSGRSSRRIISQMRDSAPLPSGGKG